MANDGKELNLNRDGNRRADPMGSQQGTGGRDMEPQRQAQIQSPAERPPRPDSDGNQQRSGGNSLIYNSFTSTYHGHSSAEKRDPPPMLSDPNYQRTRRVNFSAQLEIHEKQRPQTPTTPTVPILRTRLRSRQPTPAKAVNNENRPVCRDPTPRSSGKPERPTSRIADTSDMLRDRENSRPASSDPPLDRSKIPLFSPANKAPTDILSEVERRSNPATVYEQREPRSDIRESIEPEASATPLLSKSTLQKTDQTSWDMSKLFPAGTQPSTPLGLTSGNISPDSTISSIPTRQLHSEPTLKAYAPRTDHWDAHDLYPESWKQYLRDSPSSSSTESQSALLINKDAKSSGQVLVPATSSDTASPKSGTHLKTPSEKMREEKRVFHTESQLSPPKHETRSKSTKQVGYSELEEEEESNLGTELILIPRIPTEIETTNQSGSYLSGSDPPRKRKTGLRGLFCRTPESSAQVPFQELPVLALSFEESVELKQSTDDTGDSDSALDNTNSSKWDTVKRDPQTETEMEDEILMPRLPKRRRDTWKLGFLLIFLVLSCLAVGLAAYFMLGQNNQRDYATSGNSEDRCVVNKSSDDGFSTRYSTIRKFLTAMAEGDSELIDQPRTAQREALCWLADSDQKQISIESNHSALVQRYALAVIYFSLAKEDSGSQFSLTSTDFLSPSHECEWDVIMCGVSETVTALLLADKELSGQIPMEISNLSNLSFLDVSLNSLTGSIPTTIQRLTHLGAIPSQMGKMTKLDFLNLRSSQVRGKIPSELGRLTRLQTLLLEGNWLTGTIPSSLGNLHKAQQFNFHKNYLSGRVANDLCELREGSLLELKVDSWIECDCCTIWQ